MKKIILTASLFLASLPAIAKDQNAVFCNSEKKFHLVVKGQNATISSSGVTENYLVEEVMTFETKEELAEIKDQFPAIKERIKSALAYRLKYTNKNDTFAVSVVNGASGNKYLALIVVPISVLGSTQACK